MCILYLEDNEMVAAVVQRRLLTAMGPGLIGAIHHVKTFKEYQKELVAPSLVYEVVISDIMVPIFSGQHPVSNALPIEGELRRLCGTEVPLIFFSGDVEEAQELLGPHTFAYDKTDYEGLLNCVKEVLAPRTV